VLLDVEEVTEVIVYIKYPLVELSAISLPPVVPVLLPNVTFVITRNDDMSDSLKIAPPYSADDDKNTQPSRVNKVLAPK
jgi:hypothetical protein